jgi:hypothetical protein
MQKRLIQFENQSEEEYQEWLKTVKPIPWLKQSDILWIARMRRERREDAIYHAIHCSGGCGCEWRRHNKS